MLPRSRQVQLPGLTNYLTICGIQVFTVKAGAVMPVPPSCRADPNDLGPGKSGGAFTWDQDGTAYETCYNTASTTGALIPRNGYACNYGSESPICPTN